MARMPTATYLWPGLAQLWMRGAWSGLFLAIGFTVLLNFALVASLVWTDWISARGLIALWSSVAVLWLASAWVSHRGRESLSVDSPVGDADDAYREAQRAYLRGDYFEAEEILNRSIAEEKSDVDSRLMLATLKRHTGRLQEAADELVRLERFEGAQKWRREIGQERLLLAQAELVVEKEDELVADGIETDDVPEAA